MKEVGGPNFVPGRIIVGFQKDVSREKGEEIVSGFGLTTLDVVERFNHFLVRVPETTEDEWVKKFGVLKEVRFAEREHSLHYL